MKILDGLSSQLLAELMVQLILLALPLTALFLAARSQRMARAALKLGQIRRQMGEEARRNGKLQVKIGKPNIDEAVDAIRPPARDIAPVWSPDSSRLAWGTNRDDSVELYVADLKTGHIIRMTRMPNEDG